LGCQQSGLSMKLPINTENEKGYTLPELLVVFAVSGLLVLLSMTVYLFGEGAFNKWSRNLKDVNQLHTITHILSEEIYKAKSVQIIDANTLKVITFDDSINVYSSIEGVIYRNDKQVWEVKNKNIDLLFKKTEDGQSLNYDSGKVPIANPGFDIHMIYANGIDTLSATRRVFLRNSILWNQESE